MIQSLHQIARKLKYKIKQIFPTKLDCVYASAIPLIPQLTCIDVGASYYPHPAWQIFLRSSRTQWFAIDPNAENLGYIQNWLWEAKVTPIGEALGQQSGEQTLYVTNVDSGSSLLKPTIHPWMKHRIDESYLFPVLEKTIQTVTLESVRSKYDISGPALIKLDTQGTEFQILKSLSQSFFQNNIICIEIESTLLAQPVYQDSSHFFEVQKYLEHLGFELACLKPIQTSLPKANTALQGKGILNECDAVFMLAPNALLTRPIEHSLAMIAVYIAYDLYGEALHLVRLLVDKNQKYIEQLKFLESHLS